MNKVLEAIALALGVPVVVLIVLAFAAIISLQCWLEHKLHGTGLQRMHLRKRPTRMQRLPIRKIKTN